MAKVERKINRLVKEGYSEAAFRYRYNAESFAKAWKQKGYNVGMIRSHGPVIEGGGSTKAYYIIATKSKKRK